MKRLQKKGLGSKHKIADPITEEEEEILLEKEQLGDTCTTPQVLLNIIRIGCTSHCTVGRNIEIYVFCSHRYIINIVERDGEREMANDRT